MTHPTELPSQHFVLICMGALDIDDQKVDAADIAEMRLESNMWPLYKGTGHTKRLRLGDQCLIYVGGLGRSSQCFVGTATVGSVCSAPRGWAETDDTLVTDPATDWS